MQKNSRTLARRCAVQALYQWQLTKQPAEEIRRLFIHNKNLSGKPKIYFNHLIEQVPGVVDELDQLIEPYLQRDKQHIDLVEQAILRIATYELKYDISIPTNVVLDEAINLAKTFGTDESYKFVNGVLDKVANHVRQADSLFDFGADSKS